MINNSISTSNVSSSSITGTREISFNVLTIGTNIINPTGYSSSWTSHTDAGIGGGSYTLPFLNFRFFNDMLSIGRDFGSFTQIWAGHISQNGGLTWYPYRGNL